MKCRKTRIAASGFGIAFSLWAAAASAQPAPGPWSQSGYDQQRTSRSPVVGPRNPFILWKSATTGVWSATPAIHPNGLILCNRYKQYVGELEALSPIDGSVQWAFPTSDVSNATPSISVDGTIYTSDFDHWFYAVRPDGTLRWKKLYATEPAWTSPLLRNDNSLIFTSDGSGNNAKVFAVDGASGNLLWSANPNSHGSDVNNPILGYDGTILVNAGGGTMDHSVSALSSSGATLWTNTRLGPMDLDHGAVGTNGMVYYGSTSGEIGAIDVAGGQTLWVTKSGNAYVYSPAIGADGTVYAAASDGILRAYNPDNGALLWSFQGGTQGQTGVAIDGEGVMYFAAQDNLYAVTPAGQQLWRLQLPETTQESSPILDEGVLYIAGRSGAIYAIVPEPSTLVLLGVGALGLLAWAWRRQGQPQGGGACKRR